MTVLDGIRADAASATTSRRAGTADRGQDFASLLDTGGSARGAAAAPSERRPTATAPASHSADGDAAGASAASDATPDAGVAKAEAKNPSATKRSGDPSAARVAAPGEPVAEDEVSGTSEAIPGEATADEALPATEPAAISAGDAGTPPADAGAAAIPPLAADWLDTIRASLRLAQASDASTAEAVPGVTPGVTATAALPGRNAAPSATNADATASGAPAVPSFATTLAQEADAAPSLTMNDTDAQAVHADLPGLTTASWPGGDAVPLQVPAAVAAPAQPLTSLAAAAPLTPMMDLSPEHPDFAEAFGERIVWITDAGLSSARIEMSPQSLGAVSVHVQVRNDEAQVAFASDNPVTRAMLQQAMPQLRELFAGQGLQLLRSQIEQRSTGSSSRETTASGGASGYRGRLDATEAPRRVSRLQLVDAYV